MYDVFHINTPDLTSTFEARFYNDLCHSKAQKKGLSNNMKFDKNRSKLVLEHDVKGDSSWITIVVLRSPDLHCSLWISNFNRQTLHQLLAPVCSALWQPTCVVSWSGVARGFRGLGNVLMNVQNHTAFIVSQWALGPCEACHGRRIDKHSSEFNNRGEKGFRV
jgi:hypothetical protein